MWGSNRRGGRPFVETGSGIIGHLLCWEQHERDGSWWAWVSWVQPNGDRQVHKVVCVQAGSLAPIEAPEAYTDVPRRVLGNDGQVRPLEPPGIGAPGASYPSSA